MLFRSLDRPVRRARPFSPPIAVAVGLSLLGLHIQPIATASAAELFSGARSLPAIHLPVNTLQLEGVEPTIEDPAIVEETAPPVVPTDIVAEPEPIPAPVEAAPPTVPSTPAQVEASPPAPPANATPPAAPSSETAASALSKPSYGVSRYTVSKGDTMFSIAKKVELSLGVLSAVNNISDPNAVKVGQTLLIPAQPGSVHVAARGDTVQSIADKYQSKSDTVREANRLDKDSKIEAGQLVLIPGAVQASAAAMKPFTAAPQPPQVSAAGGISPLPAPKSAQVAPPTMAAVARAPQAAGGDTLIWPVIGPLSTNFSPAHRGLDVVANQGVPVKAALAGRVIGAAEGDGPYGWYVIVEHGGPFTSVYAHLSKIRVKVGDILEKNQILGEVGSTGQSTGPHLHFELRQSNVPIDPRPYLP